MSDHLIGPLIDRLVGELHPVRRRRPSVDAAILIGLCAIELALFLGIGTQRPDIVAGIVGLAAAAWGVFVFACPKDDPLYLLVWYPVGCVAVVARAALPVLNRW